jgi:radical SAM superfamily enzyme YgiQ (UPF0313 family)
MTRIAPLQTMNTVGFEDAPSRPLSERAKALKVLLLEPLYPAEAAWGSAKTEQGFLPPMGMISVYRWLTHRGYQVDMLDTQFGNHSEETLKAFLRTRGFDVVALPVYTPTADFAFHTARLVKEALPGCLIVMGNIHVTTLPELSMQQCPELDFIIRHEAEYTLDEFLMAVADGQPEWRSIPGLVFRDGDRVVVNPQRAFVGELDSLPLGYYGDLDLTPYVPHATQYVVLPNYPFLTQRGCPYPCSYCEAAQILGKKMRHYSPARVVEELKILRFEKGARGIYFQDSTFTMNRKFVMELMELMIQAKLDLLWSCNTRADRVDPELLEVMYRAGGRQLILGIESGNQQSLDMIKKATTVEKQTQGVEWIRKAGFRYLTSYIICLPGETADMVMNTIRYAKRLAAHTSMFYLPVPYPGSGLYESCKADGGIRREATWSDFIAIDFENPVYVNPNFGVDGMRYWYKRAHLEYYRSPKVLLQNLRLIQTPQDLSRLLSGARALTAMMTKGFWGFIKHQYRGYHGQAAPISPD